MLGLQVHEQLRAGYQLIMVGVIVVYFGWWLGCMEYYRDTTGKPIIKVLYVKVIIPPTLTSKDSLPSLIEVWTLE